MTDDDVFWREQLAHLLDVERTPFVLLENELVIQGWPQAEVDALGVEVDNGASPADAHPLVGRSEDEDEESDDAHVQHAP